MTLGRPLESSVSFICDLEGWVRGPELAEPRLVSVKNHKCLLFSRCPCGELVSSLLGPLLGRLVSPCLAAKRTSRGLRAAGACFVETKSRCLCGVQPTNKAQLQPPTPEFLAYQGPSNPFHFWSAGPEQQASTKCPGCPLGNDPKTPLLTPKRLRSCGSPWPESGQSLGTPLE